MKVFRISLASLAACAVCAVPAHAKTGNGLYEPFPTPESGGLAQTFIEGLGGSAGLAGLTGQDLQRGVVLAARADRPARPGEHPRRRGHAAGFSPSLGWPLALVLLAIALGTARVVTVRRA